MSDIFTQLGDMQAEVAKAVADGFDGITMQFSHRGTTAVPLKVRIVKSGDEILEQLGSTTQQRELTIEIATGQTGFINTSDDVQPLIYGDVFTWSGREYQVLQFWSNKYNTVYYAVITEHKQIDMGV